MNDEEIGEKTEKRLSKIIKILGFFVINSVYRLLYAECCMLERI